jgi:hypothetical protein
LSFLALVDNTDAALLVAVARGGEIDRRTFGNLLFLPAGVNTAAG